MQRFYYQRGSNTREFNIFDRTQGNIHSNDIIAKVYDIDLVEKLLNLLNKNPQLFLTKE